MVNKNLFYKNSYFTHNQVREILHIIEAVQKEERLVYFKEIHRLKHTIAQLEIRLRHFVGAFTDWSTYVDTALSGVLRLFSKEVFQTIFK